MQTTYSQYHCFFDSAFQPVWIGASATSLVPSQNIARANTVEVVEPSPTDSAVFDAASLISCAAMFSKRSDNSISFATVRPSRVMTADPNFLPNATFRPFGPNVTDTAS